MASHPIGDLRDLRDIRLIRDNDPAWIIELWLRIHDGRPGPISKERISKAALEAIKALSVHLDPVRQRGVRAALG